MTLQTIKEYFLKAGASLRRSEIWKKSLKDADGKSKIQRSGRFGVGTAAAFLIGEEIVVSTRHVDSLDNKGYEFFSKLDTDFIEIRKVNRSVGTTITIKLK